MIKSWVSEEGEVKLLYVAEWLEAGAPHVDDVLGFNMDVGVMKESCGTVCCIAGAVCQFFKPVDMKDEDHGVEAIFYGEGGVFEKAQTLLGMSIEDADHLFTPKSVSWEDVDAEHAARVIRHFVKTGNVDWSIESE